MLTNCKITKIAILSAVYFVPEHYPVNMTHVETGFFYQTTIRKFMIGNLSENYSFLSHLELFATSTLIKPLFIAKRIKKKLIYACVLFVGKGAESGAFDTSIYVPGYQKTVSSGYQCGEAEMSAH
uniref:uncharacterized protein LOC120332936 n=1 Tax=Styela clava TaxID=7725 RepID=UPI0019392DF3|nr:uncharacterized protein LOC120332936 [Styela clava]